MNIEIHTNIEKMQTFYDKSNILHTSHIQTYSITTANEPKRSLVGHV